MATTSTNDDLKPLKITCTSSDCANGLHCFRVTKTMLKQGANGRCRSCGAQLIDWGRVHRRNVKDVQYTFNALRYELIRHHFWHIPLSEYATNYARRKGKIALRGAAQRYIETAVANPTHPRQGRQTPRETSPTANIIHYGQHATASCCRKCLEEWHGILQDRVLLGEEISYLRDLVMLYVDARMPDLSTEPVRISNRSKRAIEGTKAITR